jgi:hypothetical protein
MLKFVVMSKRTVELAIARERAEKRRRPRFQSHSWHGSPSHAPSVAAEEVNTISDVSLLVTKLCVEHALCFLCYFPYITFTILFAVVITVFVPCVVYASTLKMEAICSSETSEPPD